MAAPRFPFYPVFFTLRELVKAPMFSPRKCVAFVWTADGRVVGVLLRRHGRRGRVEARWQHTLSPGQTLADALSQGRLALGIDEDTIVVIGGDASQACIADQEMPRLPTADLAKSLRFELARLSPVAVESLRWGYRILGPAGSGRQRVRLVYFPAAEWDRCLAAATGLGRGVDIILPAPAALDPTLAGRDVLFPAAAPALPLLLKATSQFSREARLLTHDKADGAFGAGTTPLRADELDLGPLASVPAEEQAEFVPALVLALYGLTGAAARDRAGFPELPADLLPRRHVALKVLVILLAVYLCAALALLGMRSLRASRQVYDGVAADNARLRVALADLERQATVQGADQAAVDELAGVLRNRHLLGTALAELSEATDERLWVSSLSWNNGDLSLVLLTSSDDATITESLSSHPGFSAFKQERKDRAGNQVEYRITCTALSVGERAVGELAAIGTSPKPTPTPTPTLVAESATPDSTAPEAAEPTDAEPDAASMSVPKLPPTPTRTPPDTSVLPRPPKPAEMTPRERMQEVLQNQAKLRQSDESAPRDAAAAEPGSRRASPNSTGRGPVRMIPPPPAAPPPLPMRVPSVPTVTPQEP